MWKSVAIQALDFALLSVPIFWVINTITKSHPLPIWVMGIGTTAVIGGVVAFVREKKSRAKS